MLIAILLASAPEPTRTIVVEAPRTRQELSDCLARSCGIREDAVASIRHAQAQFAQGQYPDARKTLLASLNRHRDAERRDPRAASALWHALARVTLHNGDRQEYRRAALRSGSILARAADVTRAEQLRGGVQIADALAMTGDVDGAVRRYRKLAVNVRAQGDVEAAEMLSLRSIAARSTIDGRPAARRALERAAADPTLSARARTSALALAAQFQNEKTGQAEKFLAQVPIQAGDTAPMLLWAPQDRYDQQNEAIARAAMNNDSTLFRMLQPRSGEARRYNWADIGFLIRPDGRVIEAELLRGSNNKGWAKDALKIVGARRYAPFQAAPGSDGHYKIERVTLTYDHQRPTGSLVRRRVGLPSYQFEELKIERADQRQ